MTSWPSVALAKLASDERDSFVDGPFGSSLKADEYVESGVPILRLQNIKPNRFVAKQIKYITAAKAKTLERHSYRPGDVAIAKLGDPCGMACVLPLQAGEGRIVADVVRFRGAPDRVDHRYLCYFINSSLGQSEIAKDAKGATRQRVNLGNFKNLAVPLPPLPEQRRIAAILDQADALLAKRREALTQLDSLTQSIFIEMFGESLLSPKRTPLGDLVEEFRYGTSEKSGDRGFPALRIPNVANGHLNLSELKTVPVEAAEFKRLQLKSGDLLFVRTNGNPENVGRCAVFEPSLVEGSGFNPAEFIYASYLIRTRLKARAVSPAVLQQYLHVGEGRHALRAVCKTSAGQYNINTEGLGAIPVPSFPIAAQEAFATRIQAVESLKTTHSAALAELDALFASLQHRAFAGAI